MKTQPFIPRQVQNPPYDNERPGDRGAPHAIDFPPLVIKWPEDVHAQLTERYWIFRIRHNEAYRAGRSCNAVWSVPKGTRGLLISSAQAMTPCMSHGFRINNTFPVQAVILDETLAEEVTLFELAARTPLLWEEQWGRVGVP